MVFEITNPLFLVKTASIHSIMMLLLTYALLKRFIKT